MTSLKAISTLQKKSKRLFSLLLVFILSAACIPAESFRFTVSGENDGYVSLFEAVLSSYPTAGSDTVISLRKERDEREAEKERLKKITGESQKEVWTENTGSTSKKEYKLLEMDKVSVDLSPYSAFLASGDSDAYTYLRAVNSLDGIFYITSQPDGDISFVSVLFNGERIHSAWYSSATEEDEERVLYSVLSPLLEGNGYHMYRMEFEPADATLAIDGKTDGGEAEYVVLPDGEHTFTLSSYGYSDKTVTLNLDGSTDTISIALEKSAPFSLLVTTYPYSAELYYNGVRHSGKYFPSSVTPYVITLEKDGFENYSYQERRPYGHITLEMAPSWTETEDILGEKKNRFYSSLFYVLASFGGYVASSSISAFCSETLGTASRVVFTGASVLSLVNLIQNAVDYYKAASIGL